MTASLVRPIAVWLCLVILSASLFTKAQVPDMEAHNKRVSTLGELQAIDATLNQDVVRARYRLLVNYDPLVQATEKMDRLLQQLGQLRHHHSVNRSEPSDVDVHFNRLVETLRQKNELVEYFKSDNAVLKNSLSYYPLALQQISSGELMMGANRAHLPGLRQLAPDLLTHIWHYIQSGDPNGRAAAEMAMNVARGYAGVPALSPRIQHVVRHTEVILDYGERVERLLSGILSLPSAEHSEALYRAHVIDHEKSVRRANFYRVLLYLFSLLLLLYTAYVFYRLRQSASTLDHERRRLEVTLHSIAEAVVTSDAHAQVEYLNPAAERLTGWDAAASRGRPLGEVLRLFGESDRRPIANPAALDGDKASADSSQLMLASRDGRELHVELSSAPIGDRSGDVIVLRDVTSAHRLTAQLSWQATHDALTGSVNRLELESRLRRALAAAQERGGVHAVLYIDLDRFKHINDNAGHAAGDEYLRGLARLFAAEVRERDTVARIGGDEFVVLLEHCSAERAQEIADAILAAVGEFRLKWGDRQFQAGASIGLAAIDAVSADVACVLRQADSACYAAKQSGGNCVKIAPAGRLRACS